MRRRSFGIGFVTAAILAAGAVPASAQLARPRVSAADAPKLLVVPFVRDNQDSGMSLVVADGVRERLRSSHLDKFNTISRVQLNDALTQSGFTVDVPLDANTVRQLGRFLNAKFVIEGSMIRKGDSILVVARLAEATGTMPQAATISLMAAASRIGTATGAEIANRLVDGYRTFDEVAECRRKLDLGDISGATIKAGQALRQYPENAGAWLCIAQIKEAEHAPEDSVIAALRNAYRRDTLATAVMRRLATKYQAKNDTTNLLDMLKRILTIDFRDNDLLISTTQMMVRMGQADSAVLLLNKALSYNPASAEILGVKAIAMAAGSHWDSAAAILAQVADIDTSKVDSLFFYRITNYYKQIPDSARWLQWVERATLKFPGQLDNWYTIASNALSKGDSVKAMTAARGLLSHLPPGEASPLSRGLAARAEYVVAMLENGHGNLDSALAHAERAVALDSTIRPSVAVVYLIAGGKVRGDTAHPNLPRAIDLLTRARDWSPPANTRLVANAAFQLGVAQFQHGAKIDAEAQTGRSCEMARMARGFVDSSETNIIAGASTNRELANQFLSNYIPAYKSREDAMIRQYCR